MFVNCVCNGGKLQVNIAEGMCVAACEQALTRHESALISALQCADKYFRI